MCGDVANSKKRVAHVSFGLVDNLWRLRAIVISERPGKIEIGCGTWKGVEVVCTKLTRAIVSRSFGIGWRVV